MYLRLHKPELTQLLTSAKFGEGIVDYTQVSREFNIEFVVDEKKL